jgi:RimJ/RimL family protein N-acetyltransferase
VPLRRTIQPLATKALAGRAAGGDDNHVATVPELIPIRDIVLRRERLDDVDLVASTVRESLDHLRPWMPWATPAAATGAAQRERIIRVEQWWDAGSDFTFLLMDAVGKRMLGHFGLHSRIGPSAIEIGYWLAPDATGHGYATSAAGALTKAALDDLDVVRVEIHCDEANARSQRIPQRLGYRLDRVEDDEIEAPAEVGRSMIWIFPAAQ